MKSSVLETKLKHLRKPISSETRGFQRNVQEYMINSTFHGLNYVGDTKLSFTERLFFVLAFLVVSALSTYYISNMWLKWTATPMIISADPVATSISDFPFPATTVCNMNQARKSIVKEIKPNSFEELQLKTLCMRNDEKHEIGNFTSSWKLYKKFLLRVQQPCDEMLVMCKFGNQPIDCLKVFETALTDDGLCCTFNQVHQKFIQKNYRIEDDFDFFEDSDYQPVDWDPENGYGTTVLTKNMYPRVAPGSGTGVGLTLILNSNRDEYYCSSTNSAGFKLLLHNPIDTPLVENFGILIRTGYHSRLAISPHIPVASPLIRSIPRQQRQCMFTSEANLTYFRYYTKRSCDLECKSRTIEKECGCVPYYMPRFTDDTKICSQGDAECYDEIKMAIDSSFNDTFNCKCLPGCFSIIYGAQISMNKFNVTGRIKDPILQKYDPKFLRKNIAMVTLYYDDNIVRKNVKNQFVGFIDFLCKKLKFKDRFNLNRIKRFVAGTGGLLSLFMGFIAISIIEIIYYATFRPYFEKKRLQAKYDMQVTIGEPKSNWKNIMNIDK